MAEYAKTPEPQTFREVVERLMPQFGDHLVTWFNWQNEVVQVPTDGMHVKYAHTGAVELYFSLDVRRPELVPWANRTDPSDQSGDYESTSDLNALIDEIGLADG